MATAPRAGVKVAVRTRPTASFASDCIKVNEQQVSIKLPKGPHSSDNAQDSWSWKFDAVLHNSSQETTYNEVVLPVVQSVLQGYNGTVMCYGQTGAGKTYTQLGGTASFEYRGVSPRAIAEIFNFVHDSPQYDATIGVSYLEIYNDSLVDLLSTLPSEDPNDEPLALIEDADGTTHVKGLRVEKVTSEEKALQLLFEGETNRAVAKHALNSQSTRGHAVFTIYLQLRSRVESSERVVRCKLNLVDLAGSERVKKTGTSGELKAESMYINRSLTYLEQVVVALGKGAKHTPYRQSKLTHLLKDSLGGNCKTLLIANIYGEVAYLEETIATLQFAARVRAVQNQAHVVEFQDPAIMLKKYEHEIADLKRELAMHNSLASRSRVSYEPYSEQQRFELLSKLESFFNHEMDELEIESVRQMRELLSAARQLYGGKQSELETLTMRITNGEISLPGTAGDAPGAAPGMEDPMEDGVGDDDRSKSLGLAIGRAPDGAKPTGGLIEPPAGARRAPKFNPRTASSRGEGLPGSPGSTRGAGEEVMDRQEAFTQFKAAEGAETNNALLAAKATCKQMRAKRAELGGVVNASKQRIDYLRELLDNKKAEREASVEYGGESEIIDEEEYAYIQELKEVKSAYKQAHAEMRAANAAMETASSTVDETRAELLKQFESWYTLSFSEEAEYDTMNMSGLSQALEQTSASAREAMDEDEQFEQLQLDRVMAEEPDSLAFVNARKAVLKKGGAKAGGRLRS